MHEFKTTKFMMNTQKGKEPAYSLHCVTCNLHIVHYTAQFMTNPGFESTIRNFKITHKKSRPL